MAKTKANCAYSQWPAGLVAIPASSFTRARFLRAIGMELSNMAGHLIVLVVIGID